MNFINVTTDEDFRYNSSKTVTYIVNFLLEFVKRFGCNVKFKIRKHKYSEIAHQIMQVQVQVHLFSKTTFDMVYEVH